jgi:hypothetical protein
MIMSVLNQINVHSQRKIAVTETEAIMLYKMIRDVGREVSHDFHTYKKSVNQVARACTDYEDMQKMVTEARDGQDVPTQLQMEFLLRKNRREIDGLNEDARNSRDSLVTLAGAEAVDILDKQIATESEKIGQPLLPQEGIPKEEGADGKVACKAAPKRKKVPVATAKPEGDESSADEDAADKSPADKSSDKPL